MSPDRKASQLLRAINETVEDGVVVAVQPVVVEEDVELSGFGEVGELVEGNLMVGLRLQDPK